MDTVSCKNGNQITINRDNGQKRFVQLFEIALTHLLKENDLSRLITNKVRHPLRDSVALCLGCCFSRSFFAHMKGFYFSLLKVLGGEAILKETNQLDVETFDGVCAAPDWMVWAEKMKRLGKHGIPESNAEVEPDAHICKYCGNNLKDMVIRRCCMPEDNRLRRDVHNPVSQIFNPRNVLKFE